MSHHTRQPPREDEQQRFMRTTVLPLYTGMARLLALMVGDAGRERWKRDGPWLCRCEFHHQDFDLSVVCRDKRIRPFLVYMERPGKHSVYLGRLKPDGSVHIYDHGMRAFFTQLVDEGVLEPFTRALQDAVARYEALDREAAAERDEPSRRGPRPDPTATGVTQ